MLVDLLHPPGLLVVPVQLDHVLPPCASQHKNKNECSLLFFGGFVETTNTRCSRTALRH
jgi:hypothetical protein